MSNELIKGLNPQQTKAVQTINGPILILAGAGSGKTKTLTHRIAYLINHEQVNPMNILAVTFTNKAAREMRERVSELLAVDAEDRTFIPYLGTFHSVCVKLLRIKGEEIGLDRNFVIFDSSDSRSAVKQAMRQVGASEKQTKPRTIAGMISSAKNELVGPHEYRGLATTPQQKVAADVYPVYQQILRDAGALDFDDIIMRTVELCRSAPHILEEWQQRFQHILVDEYQDTNTAQYQLVKMLAAAHHNICVVGDDWQSIYSWRGADFRNILNFERDYPEVTTIKLEQNYRSTEHILNAAHSIIENNTQRSKKKLWTDIQGGEPVKIHDGMNERHEGEIIVNHVKAAVDSGYRKYNDVAVLYRTNAQSRSLEDSLIRYNIPYRIVGGTRFYDRKEIKDIMAYLRLLYQPNDRASFDRVINVPTRGIGDKSVQAIFDWLGEEKEMIPGALPLDYQQPQSLAEALERIESCPGLSTRAHKPLRSFNHMMNQLRSLIAEGAVVSEVVDMVIKRTGYLDFLEDGTMQAEERIENVKELISVAREYDDVGLDGFLEEVALISDIDAYDVNADAITLMTLHAAKGLEFPVVFMTGMEESIFPHSRALYDQEEMEEERRLCYVGMTRAKEELHLVHVSSRLLYGTSQHNPPSRFLSEIEAEHAQDRLPQPLSSEPKVVPEVEIELDVGDKVKHHIFGEGVVQRIEDDVADIRFNGRGVKSLNLAFAPIKKIS